MKKQYHPHFLWLLLGLLTMLGACTTDDCTSIQKYKRFMPVTMTKTEFRNAAKVEQPRSLEQPGKIYVSGRYIFINEQNKGIHIVDNSNPQSPRNIAFVNIPANVDMAVRDHIMYADSDLDLLVFDISNPAAVRLIRRVEGAFPKYNGYTPEHITVGYQEVEITEVSNSGCSGGTGGIQFFAGDLSLSSRTVASMSPSNPSKGGSMARFAVTGNHLYTVSSTHLRLFDITSPEEPQAGDKINLGFGIETIFPYNQHLFIGSTQGMHIYSNSNPSNPVRVSVFEHARACDPVVVEGNYAYVTLRSGTTCMRGVNQLEVVNIVDPAKPQLVKTYPMQNPHGLGIDNGTLFICEGDYGLKVFNAANPLSIDQSQLAHFKGMNAYDVIPLGKILLMTGKDGLYQYDYSDARNLKLLSIMKVMVK